MAQQQAEESNFPAGSLVKATFPYEQEKVVATDEVNIADSVDQKKEPWQLVAMFLMENYMLNIQSLDTLMDELADLTHL